jgi:hypothetical protein
MSGNFFATNKVDCKLLTQIVGYLSDRDTELMHYLKLLDAPSAVDAYLELEQMYYADLEIARRPTRKKYTIAMAMTLGLSQEEAEKAYQDFLENIHKYEDISTHDTVRLFRDCTKRESDKITALGRKFCSILSDDTALFRIGARVLLFDRKDVKSGYFEFVSSHIASWLADSDAGYKFLELIEKKKNV